ncbi:MAG TPA: sensor histidine kinase [Thermoanaerobaculia bacterium]
MRLIPARRDLGWTPYVWTIYLAFFFIGPLARHASAAEWTATIAAALAFLYLYFRGYWVRGRSLMIVIAAITAIGLIFFPTNPGAGCFFIYAGSFAGVLTPPRLGAGLIAAILAAAVVEAAAFHLPVWVLWELLFIVVVGAVNMYYSGVSRSNAKLELAQHEIEHLAKVAERERIARDLHDLLGHTLSLIILKAELASKLAERDAERARDEIRDVERISRDALAQVRAAVSGYRAGLRAEIDSAREALTAAGVTPTIDVAPLRLPPAQEAVIAMALREAVTNIVRHAGATSCRIVLAARGDAVAMTVSDDGGGGNAPFGTGLSGMRERVEALGGSLRRDGARGTMLEIVLPSAAAAERIA